MIIHVLDENENIVEFLENKDADTPVFWDDEHHEKEENAYNVYQFTTTDDGNNPAAPYLLNKRKFVIEDLDGNFYPFIIEDAEQDSANGIKRIVGEGEHLELRTANIIPPTSMEGVTLNLALDQVLQGTRWQRGITEYAGSRTIKIEEHKNSLAVLNQIKSAFDVQLRYRVEIKGSKIVGRYVDALITEDVYDGKEIVFSKDLIGVTRNSNSQGLYTALVGVGQADADGNFITFESINGGKNYVEDVEATQRWSSNGKPLIGIYKVEAKDGQTLTPEIVKAETEKALKNVVESIVKYDVKVAYIEQIPGLSHEKVRRGMTARIKSEKFSPPLYLEARVLETKRSYTKKDTGSFVLGNYREVKVVKDPAIAELQSKLFRNEQ
ncbi:phage tail spike protein, partial [Rossellomorea sp. BNER]|uniref:phage tail spike protein n=1 Tax=Rossellomorea sp. BNER TaxID=2962031 RepID=UPI003AF22FC6|nr:phage tail protein [Rossellomorea sp. BNER]